MKYLFFALLAAVSHAALADPAPAVQEPTAVMDAALAKENKESAEEKEKAKKKKLKKKSGKKSTAKKTKKAK